MRSNFKREQPRGSNGIESSPLLSLLLFVVVLASCTITSAARIKKIKGKKILISLQRGERVKKKSIYVIIGKNNKRIGYLRIKKTSPLRAWGYLIKGRARKGASIYRRSDRKSHRKSRRQREVRRNHALGMLVGANLSSLEVTKTFNSDESVTVETTGTNINYKMFYDYSLKKRGPWVLRMGLAYEPFITKGTASLAICQNSRSCKTNISYLRTDTLLYYRWAHSYSPWLGIGASLLLPLSKESNMVREDDINSSQGITVAFGLNKKISSRAFIPFNVEYNYLLSSSQVSPSLIGFQIGYGFLF